MALSGKVGGVYAPSTTAGTDIVGELHDGGGTTVITLLNEYVQPYSEAVTVGGTAQTRDVDYTINYITGEITPLGSGFAVGVDNVSVDYTYYTMVEVGGFFEWSVDETADILESTSFDITDDHKTYVAGLEDWTGSANRYWASSKLFDEWLGNIIVVALYMDKDTGMNRFEGWGILNTKSTSVAVDTLVEESIEFQGSGDLTYRAG